MDRMRTDVNTLPEPGLQRLLCTIGMYQALTNAEESALLRRIRNGGREPLDQVVNANLHRVVGIAREYVGHGLSHLDLIAEGILGLISAARRFDERHLVCFRAHAEGVIRRRILQALGGPA